MKKIIFFLVLIFASSFLLACTKTKPTLNDFSLLDSDSSSSEKMPVKEESGEKKFTDQDNNEYLIKKDKKTNQASIEVNAYFDESIYGHQIDGIFYSMIPMTFNHLCSSYSFYLVGNLVDDDLISSEILSEEMGEYLRGSTINHYLIKFKNSITNQDIAQCQADRAGEENIKVKIFKDYDLKNSYLGIKMGDFEN